jgi:hypothetical protein
VGSSTYRRSKSLAADVARCWNQLKVERGKYLDEISTLAQLVKTLLEEKGVPSTPVIDEDQLNPSEQRTSLVENLQEIVLIMKDALIEVERSLHDIIGNDLMKPLTPGKVIDLVQMEVKQLDLLSISAKNYLKVKNRVNENLPEENQSQIVESAINDLSENFRTLQDQIQQTEEIFNNVYEEMTKQRDLADLLEKKQFL